MEINLEKVQGIVGCFFIFSCKNKILGLIIVGFIWGITDPFLAK